MTRPGTARFGQANCKDKRELEERGFAQNTAILFLSDNGDMMGDYMLGGKELLFDVSLGVPKPRKHLSADNPYRA